LFLCFTSRCAGRTDFGAIAMRFPLTPTVCVLLATAAAAAAAAERTFPYKANITAPEAVLRSGPGESYYVTEKVRPGIPVEVYHRDPAGWLAVRPLPDSFSWVSSRHLKIGKDGLAEVTDDRVASRVGSRFGDTRDVVQVRLKRGEVVELADPRAAADGPVPWHKIVPPAGEFRWIHEKFTDGSTASAVASDGAAPAAAPVAQSPTSIPTPATPVAAASLAPTPAAAPGEVRLPTGVTAAVAPEQFRSELDDINAQLSLVLAQPPTRWQCAPLAERVEKLLGQTQNVTQRSEARAVAQRIAQAEEVRRRYETPAAARAGLDPAAGGIAGQPSRSRSPDPRYDGAGRLVPVEPAKIGGPRYALVDDRGRVLNYVVPAPGVNMGYYVGRRVGVTGTRTPLLDQDSELVTARHISPLEGRLR
jgi:SH3-like domain-containing protein